jgi:hypothetical protein
VDKSTLEFFKDDAGGLIDDTDIPETWATDELIDDSYSRSITIPTGVEAGYYVLRHEIIALHGAEDLDGAQNLAQLFTLQEAQQPRLLLLLLLPPLRPLLPSSLLVRQ